MARRDPNPLWTYIYVPTVIVVTSDEIPPNILLQTSSPPIKDITDICLGKLIHAPGGKWITRNDMPDVWGMIKDMICQSKKQI